MGSMSIMHWTIVIAVVVLLFGRGKISEMMGDLADGIKSFKRGMQEEAPTSSSVPHAERNVAGEPFLAAPKGRKSRSRRHVF